MDLNNAQEWASLSIDPYWVCTSSAVARLGTRMGHNWYCVSVRTVRRDVFMSKGGAFECGRNIMKKVGQETRPFCEEIMQFANDNCKAYVLRGGSWYANSFATRASRSSIPSAWSAYCFFQNLYSKFPETTIANIVNLDRRCIRRSNIGMYGSP